MLLGWGYSTLERRIGGAPQAILSLAERCNGRLVGAFYWTLAGLTERDISIIGMALWRGSCCCRRGSCRTRRSTGMLTQRTL